MDGRLDGRLDGGLDGWLDGRLDGELDGKLDGELFVKNWLLVGVLSVIFCVWLRNMFFRVFVAEFGFELVPVTTSSGISLGL